MVASCQGSRTDREHSALGSVAFTAPEHLSRYSGGLWVHGEEVREYAHTPTDEQSKSIPVGLQGCNMLRLTDGGEVLSPTHRPRSIPQKYSSASGIHFC
jgi:hypothetical protein